MNRHFAYYPNQVYIGNTTPDELAEHSPALA